MHRRALIAVAATFAVIVGLALPAFSTGSVGTASGFEDDDANLVVDTTFDWNGFTTAADPIAWTGTAPYRTSATVKSGWSFKGFEDAAVSATDSGFAGGVKQDNDCGTYKVGKAPNKDDLKRIYLSTKTVSGDVFLNLAWVRIPQNSTSASAHVGFEFNQADGTVTANKCAAPSPLVKRTGGDMLVVYDFEGGADPPAIKLSRWLTTAWVADHPVDTTCEVNNSTVAAGCWGNTKIISDLGFAEGKVNLATVTDSLKPSGATNPGPVEFGEAGINLTDAGVFGENQCAGFGSAYAVSRSSGNSSQAAMEDIVGPGPFSISNCGTVTLHKTGVGGTGLAGAGFTLYKDVGTVGTYEPAVDTTSAGTCTTDSSGDCTTQFTNLATGAYCMVETSTPAGYSTADAQCFTLSAGQTKALTFADSPLLGTINVHKTDDRSDTPLAGAIFTLYTDNAPTGSFTNADVTTGSTCQTGANGNCSFTNVPLGTYCVVETTTPSGYDTADPQCNLVIDVVNNGRTLNLTFANPRKFTIIVLVCRQSDNTLYKSTVTVDGTNKTSLGTGGGGTITDAQLCALGGAAYSGKHTGDHAANVNIPTNPLP
jgi:hypothetical protein